ncbi:MAG: hypothetical protein WDN26_14255 [Chitinophagaceae bacterium]
MRPFGFAPTTFVGASRVIPIAIGSDALLILRYLLNREQKDERSVATGDDSSNAAGLMHGILRIITLKGV